MGQMLSLPHPQAHAQVLTHNIYSNTYKHTHQHTYTEMYTQVTRSHPHALRHTHTYLGTCRHMQTYTHSHIFTYKHTHSSTHGQEMERTKLAELSWHPAFSLLPSPRMPPALSAQTLDALSGSQTLSPAREGGEAWET